MAQQGHPTIRVVDPLNRHLANNIAQLEREKDGLDIEREAVGSRSLRFRRPTRRAMIRPSCSPMNKPGAEAIWFDPARTKQSCPLARGVRESACVYSSVPAGCSGGNKWTIWRIRVIWQLTRLRIGRYTSISFRQHKEIWLPGTRCSPEATNRLQHHGDGFRGIDADAEGLERAFAGPIVVGIIFGGTDDV